MQRFLARYLVVTLLAVAVLGVSLFPVPASGTSSPNALAPHPSFAVAVAGPASPTFLSVGSRELAPAYSPSPGVATVGPLPSTTPITVAVGLSGADPTGLAGLISAQYAPGTPEYHHFETPSELAARFGSTPSDVLAVEQYFEPLGLSTVLSPDHLLLYVSGPSARVAAAFGTTFEEYRAPDARLFFSHPTSATLPRSVPASGVYGLGNTTPFVPESAGAPPVETEISPGASCVGVASVLTPCQVWQAYNISSLLSAGTNGSGVTLAVVDAYSSAENQSRLSSDLSIFATDAALAAGVVNFVYPDPAPRNLNASTNPGWALEDALDLEWARAAAPGATLDMVLSPNAGIGLYEAVDWLVAHQATNIISLSWGENDVGVYNAFSTPCSTACNASTDGTYGVLAPVLEFAAAEGIGVFAATGDCGASDGTSGLSTNFPASDPTVTGVGGTVLTVNAAGDWTSEVGWSGNNSGATAPGCENQGGSGGGYAPFAHPTWQTGVPAGTTHRGVPDVSLDAGTPVVVIEDGSLVFAEGTSLATPVWAGVAALADQYVGGPLGFLDPELYAIAAHPANYSQDFHDIISGENGYSAGVGWDPVTGLGSPRASSLIVDLSHPVPVQSNSAASFVYASPRFGRAPLTVSFHVNATGGTRSYPLEGVSFGDGNASFAPNGSTTHTYVDPGVYSVTAYVADSDANYAISPPVAVVVGGGGALSVNLTASTRTPARDAAVAFSVQVTGGVGPYRYNYSFGDGTFLTNSSQSTTSHTYGADGSYCAAVVVSDSATPVDGGASARVAIGVGAAAAPDCRNDSVPLSLVPNLPITVRDAPADFLSLFNVSGGSTGSGALAPSLQFSSADPYLSACECAIVRSPGTYRITEFVNDSENEQANASLIVTVSPALTGMFAAGPTYGVAPLTVSFHASAMGGNGANASATVWSFGDGHHAVGASVSETFDAPGRYVAVGQLSDRGEGNASEAFLIDVAAGDATSATLPYLTASISPAVDVAVGAPVDLTAQLIATNGSVLPSLVHWQWGSGSSAYRSSLNWTFSPAGLGANGTLVVEVNASGLQVPVSAATTIDLPSFGARGAGGASLAADALVLLAHGGPNRTSPGVPWNASGTLRGPGTVSLNWEFGDGVQLTNLSVSHAYLANGFYTVTAEASDSWGDTAADEFGTAMAEPMHVNVSLSPSSGVAPLTVSFGAVASGGVGPPYFFGWSFGAAAGSISEPNGTTTLASSGTYAVVVVVTDLLGDSEKAFLNITVAPASSAIAPVILLLGGAGVGAAFAIVAVGYSRRRRAERAR